jgi:hypothetical protein
MELLGWASVVQCVLFQWDMLKGSSDIERMDDRWGDRLVVVEWRDIHFSIFTFQRPEDLGEVIISHPIISGSFLELWKPQYLWDLEIFNALAFGKYTRKVWTFVYDAASGSLRYIGLLHLSFSSIAFIRVHTAPYISIYSFVRSHRISPFFHHHLKNNIRSCCSISSKPPYEVNQLTHQSTHLNLLSVSCFSRSLSAELWLLLQRSRIFTTVTPRAQIFSHSFIKSEQSTSSNNLKNSVMTVLSTEESCLGSVSGADLSSTSAEVPRETGQTARKSSTICR